MWRFALWYAPALAGKAESLPRGEDFRLNGIGFPKGVEAPCQRFNAIVIEYADQKEMLFQMNVKMLKKYIKSQITKTQESIKLFNWSPEEIAFHNGVIRTYEDLLERLAK